MEKYYPGFGVRADKHWASRAMNIREAWCLSCKPVRKSELKKSKSESLFLKHGSLVHAGTHTYTHAHTLKKVLRIYFDHTW